MITNTPRPLNDSSRPTLEPSSTPTTNTSFAHAQTSEVNLVQSTSSLQPRGKKKNKGKSKKPSNEQDNTKTVDTQMTRRPKSLCMICEEK